MLANAFCQLKDVGIVQYICPQYVFQLIGPNKPAPAILQQYRKQFLLRCWQFAYIEFVTVGVIAIAINAINNVIKR